MNTEALLDLGLLPDWLIRRGIRRLLRQRLELEDRGSAEANAERRAAYARSLAESPLALRTEEANQQHYEVPAVFFERVLGRHLKYSCGLWDGGVDTLDGAEAAMLALTIDRAGIEDGMDILELGCGWGSLSLSMAKQFPASKILAVSNSHGQRRFIEARCKGRGITNLEVVTRDVNDFETVRRFDRVVSVEMFEHVRNYAVLLEQISVWLRPTGRLFAHLFVHKEHAYPFETDGAANWLGRHFFTGGHMPSADLLPSFDDHMLLETEWGVSGVHYARTARAWLANLDAQRPDVLKALTLGGGAVSAKAMLQRWRVFFMACEELWGFAEGREWYVQHYLFRPISAGEER